MLFNSLAFLIFLPIVFILHWSCPHRLRWAVMLFASYFFYMYWNWKLVFLILFTTVLSYTCGLLLEKYRHVRKVKIAVLCITLLCCFGLLLIFKYFNFFFEIFSDIAHLFGAAPPNGIFVILLPVGISFYTFQTASYVIDVYRGKIGAERHFGYYALFVSFFPQLVAGPIERPEDLIPQLRRRKKLFGENGVDFPGALRIMLLGFFKKVAVADIIGLYVNRVWENLSGSNGFSVFLAALLFSFQIYCDFSGYSDIAVGCAKLFGIKLTENFQSPYRSKSIKEFWNRWHISLSGWLRDYIYFPLGGSRVSKVRWAMNILVVFLVSGLWHGARYTFLIWGLMHAVFQIIGSLTLRARNTVWRKLHVSPDGKLVSALRTAGCFTLVCFSWIFFRADTLTDAFTALGKLSPVSLIAGANPGATCNGFGALFFIYASVSIVLLLCLEGIKTMKWGRHSPLKYGAVRFSAYLAMAWCVICTWIYLQSSSIGSSFIYFQF